MCKQARHLIDLYVAGDLTPAESEEVALHLEGCEACRREAASYRSCLENLRALNSVGQPSRLSPFFWQGIQRQILSGTDGKERPRRFWLGRAAISVAAALVIAVGAYLLISWLDRPEPDSSLRGPAIAEKGSGGGELLPPGTPLRPGEGFQPAGQPEEPSLEF